MNDKHEKIWLIDIGDFDGTVVWCQDQFPNDEIKEEDTTGYIRADLVEAKDAEIASLKEQLAESENRGRVYFNDNLWLVSAISDFKESPIGVNKQRMFSLLEDEKYKNEQASTIQALEARCALLTDAMQTFVNRCDAGEVRSNKTYSQFKHLLSAIPEQSLSALKADTLSEFMQFFETEFSQYAGKPENLDEWLRLRNEFRLLVKSYAAQLRTSTKGDSNDG